MNMRWSPYLFLAFALLYLWPSLGGGPKIASLVGMGILLLSALAQALGDRFDNRAWGMVLRWASYRVECYLVGLGMVTGGLQLIPTALLILGFVIFTAGLLVIGVGFGQNLLLMVPAKKLRA